MPTQVKYWNGTAWTDEVAPTVSMGERKHVPVVGSSVPGATSALAIVALVMAVFAPCLAPVAMILARMATRQIDESQGQKSGRPIATAAFIVGVIDLVMLVLFFGFAIIRSIVSGN